MKLFVIEVRFTSHNILHFNYFICMYVCMYLFVYFLRQGLCVVQARLELVVFLPQPPEFWDCG